MRLRDRTTHAGDVGHAVPIILFVERLQMQTEPQDFITVVVAILALVTSKELAGLVGPYAGIAACACAGAAVSLSGNDESMTVPQALGYVLLRVLLATILTVGLAELLQHVMPAIKPRYSLIPLAFAIGWIRDYSSLRAWLGDTIQTIISRRVDRP
jgi:hypothetical protein